jgi:hypothetical protein
MKEKRGNNQREKKKQREIERERKKCWKRGGA